MIREVLRLKYECHLNYVKIGASCNISRFKGQLQCDGYSGYSWIADSTYISRDGCMLHTRRKFTDVIKISKSDGLAQQALIYFQKLYAVEKHAHETNAIA